MGRLILFFHPIYCPNIGVKITYCTFEYIYQPIGRPPNTIAVFKSRADSGIIIIIMHKFARTHSRPPARAVIGLAVVSTFSILLAIIARRHRAAPAVPLVRNSHMQPRCIWSVYHCNKCNWILLLQVYAQRVTATMMWWVVRFYRHRCRLSRKSRAWRQVMFIAHAHANTVLYAALSKSQVCWSVVYMSCVTVYARPRQSGDTSRCRYINIMPKVCAQTPFRNIRLYTRCPQVMMRCENRGNFNTRTARWQTLRGRLSDMYLF